MMIVQFPGGDEAVRRRAQIRDDGWIVTERDLWMRLGDYFRLWGSRPVWMSVEAVS